MTALAISMRDVSKTYKPGWGRAPVKALHGLSLTVQAGEAFGFVGPNGAGKSSAIRLMMGLAQPDSGIIELFGTPANSPQARRHVGYVPESPYLYDYLTPTEILRMSMRLHRITVADPDRHISEWLDRLSLTNVANARIRSFSKGMVQRVAIAQALAIRPRMLVLDEPLSGLDPIGRREVVELLAEYKRDGGTLFFTSHVLHDVERLADRYGLIHHGELRSVSSPAELVGENDLLTVRFMAAEAPGELVGVLAEGIGRWQYTCPRAQLRACIECLLRVDAHLLEVRPNLSLESAFMRVIDSPSSPRAVHE